MPHRESKRPGLQASGRAQESSYMVAQSRPEVTRRDAALSCGIAIAAFALIAWSEAGAAPALAGTLTTAPMAALMVQKGWF